jgi:hypothetical protein
MQALFRGAVLLTAALVGHAMAEADVHLAATAGLSAGGETLAEVFYLNGDSEKIKSGGLMYAGVGPSVEFKGTPWALQALIGHHFDTVHADNGDLHFRRNTLDTQLFYRVGDHRLGVGLVNHFGVELEVSGFGQPGITGEFDNATGAALEYNWLPVGSKVGVSLRAVKIDYELDSVNGIPVIADEISGDHVAVGLYLYL